MKTVLVVLIILISIVSDIHSQGNVIILVDSTSKGIRDFYSIKRNGTLLKDIYIQEGIDQNSQNTQGGKYFKLNDTRNSIVHVPYLDPANCSDGKLYPIDHLVQSRSNPEVMLFHGLYKCGNINTDYIKLTTNGGATIKELPFGGGNRGEQCYGFEIQPSDFNVIYVLHKLHNGKQYMDAVLWKSTDWGVTWDSVNTLYGIKPLERPYSISGVHGGFLKSPFWNSNILFVNGYSTLLASGDKGQKFFYMETVNNIMHSFFDDYGRYFHGLSSDNRLFENQGHPLYNSWSSAQMQTQFNTIEVNPSNHYIWYGGTNDGVYKSIDRGRTWFLFHSFAPHSNRVIGIAKDDYQGDTIIVATDQRVYKITGSTTNIYQGQEIIHNYELKQNFPNPFNPATNIVFSIPVRSNVSIKVFDILGNMVGNIADGNYNAGEYSVYFDASSLSSGVYYYTLKTDSYSATKKMLLLK